MAIPGVGNVRAIGARDFEITVSADRQRLEARGLSIDDVVAAITLIFAGGTIPGPITIADCDCSHSVDIDDVVYLVAYIFSNGPFPCHN